MKYVNIARHCGRCVSDIDKKLIKTMTYVKYFRGNIGIILALIWGVVVFGSDGSIDGNNSLSSCPSDLAKTKTVLLVDDDQSLRELTILFLEGFGYEVVVAIDGLEAWKLLSVENKIDIILSDNHMPKMTGFELAEKVRDENLGIPFVMFSGGAIEDEADGINLEEKGISRLLSKPYHSKELRQALEDTLNKP